FLVALSLPLVPLSAAYLLIVPFMGAARGFRNKNLLVVTGGVFGIFAGLGFNIYIQRGAARLGDPAWIVANIAGPETLLARLGGAYPPARLAATALAAPDGKGALHALACLAIGLAAAFLVVILLGPAYARSLVGFGEASLRRLPSASPFIARVMRRRPRMEALFLREWRLMNRDPSYFLNGPFIVFMMPVIFAVMAFAQREALADIQGFLAGLAGSPYPMLAAAAFGSFLGTGTSIACTALSRDAKALPYIKALPLPYSAYMLAKLLHGLAFAGLGALIGAGGGALVLGLGAWQSLGAVGIALSFAALVNLAGLWLDTANPRLVWDNPLAALKQNPNSVILILSDMGALAGLGVLSSRLPLGAGAFVALYGGGSALLFGLLLAAYPRYAERRIAAIEA
ncbi:MAG: hypothetical protein JNG85_02770, partial [Spirochaetaceae bacterium]|nr:hypothetical protein [Spirochaetaceae bacterium]